MQLNAVSSQLSLPVKAPVVAPAVKPAEQDRMVRLGSTVAHAAAGAFTGYKFGQQVGDHFLEVGNAFKTDKGFQAALPGIQKVFQTGMRGAGMSALIGAGVSVVANGVSIARGQTDTKTAVGNVLSDAITSGVGGFGAVAAAGAGNLILRSFGIAALPLTIGTAAFGAAGGVAAGRLAQSLQRPKTPSAEPAA